MTNSEVHRESKQLWLKPEQIEELRNAVYDSSPSYLQQRDETLIVLMYDTGLRVSELVALNTEMLDFDDGVLRIPSEIQKTHPNGQSPVDATLGLDAETQRLIRSYLNNRWKDTRALFPSRSSDRISKRAVQNLVKKLAMEAKVQPYVEGGGRASPEDLHPHALRHSVPYRMLMREEETLNQVKRRLRHSSILTTERIYEHLDVR